MFMLGLASLWQRDAAIFPYRPMRRPGPAAQHTHKRKNPYEMVGHPFIACFSTTLH
jgi:hypothetical protein